MIIKKKTFHWTPVDATDVAGYRIYLCEGDTFYYTCSSGTVPADVYEILLPDFFVDQGIPMGEGTYTLGVAPFDASGNEPDPFLVTYPFDLTPPPPVTFAEVVDVSP